MERLADAQQRALEQQKARQAGLQPEIGLPRPPAGRTRTKGSKPPGRTDARRRRVRQETGRDDAPPAPKACRGRRTPPPGGPVTPNGPPRQRRRRRPMAQESPPERQAPGRCRHTAPHGASTNGGAQRGSTEGGEQRGSPAPRSSLQGQPRSAKKRPEKGALSDGVGRDDRSDDRGGQGRRPGSAGCGRGRTPNSWW